MIDQQLKLTISIPCYNQPALLRRSLKALREQTFNRFAIEIIDDNSSDDYKPVLSEFADLNISYIRNKKNLGAIGNIFNSISKHVETPYHMSLHEDDVLHKDYLRVAIEILDQEKDTVFVGCSMIWFADTENLERKQKETSGVITMQYEVFDAHQFVLKLLKGIHFGLGSVIYRSSVTEHSQFDLEQFSVLCDRPYLVNLIKDKQCAVLKNPGIFVRDHGKDDHRGDNIAYNHIFNLFFFYKSFIKNKKEKKVFFLNSTNNILYSYHNLVGNIISFSDYINRAKKEGLLRFSSINGQGILGIYKGLIKRI